MSEDKQNDKQQEESLSFEALTAELGDVSIPVKDDEKKEKTSGDKPASDAAYEDIGGTVMAGDEFPERTPMDEDLQDRINNRILTGASPKARPVWVEGMFCGVLSAVIIAPAALRIALTAFQPWLSLMVMLLAGGGALWSLYGLRVEESQESRRMCVVSAVVCAVVALVAFLVRVPPSG